MIKRFKEVTGKDIYTIGGQDRFAFAHSDTNDFYDLIEWSKSGGYQGSVIMFFDFASGNIYKPFAKKRNVLYSDPVYAEGFYYFLQGDYDEKKITLYRYIPEQILEKVTELSTAEVNLYNLRLIGNPIHIISQEDSFACYYPEKISFALSNTKDYTESAVCMKDGKICFEAWLEEGWDEENDCAGDDFVIYEKVVIRDYQGNMLSEEDAVIHQAPDGTWWIA